MISEPPSPSIKSVAVSTSSNRQTAWMANTKNDGGSRRVTTTAPAVFAFPYACARTDARIAVRVANMAASWGLLPKGTATNRP